jgi:hypothetical protein
MEGVVCEAYIEVENIEILVQSWWKLKHLAAGFGRPSLDRDHSNFNSWCFLNRILIPT